MTARDSAARLVLPRPDAPAAERYVMPDPDGLAWAYEDAYRATWYGHAYGEQPPETVTLPRSTMVALLWLAEGYTAIIDAPTVAIALRKTRDVMRALRLRRQR